MLLGNAEAELCIGSKSIIAPLDMLSFFHSSTELYPLPDLFSRRLHLAS